MLRALRRRFWLAAMDVFFVLTDWGNTAYFWALRKASDATDWEPITDEECGDAPF